MKTYKAVVLTEFVDPLDVFSFALDKTDRDREELRERRQQFKDKVRQRVNEDRDLMMLMKQIEIKGKYLISLGPSAVYFSDVHHYSSVHGTNPKIPGYNGRMTWLFKRQYNLDTIRHFYDADKKYFKLLNTEHGGEKTAKEMNKIMRNLKKRVHYG